MPIELSEKDAWDQAIRVLDPDAWLVYSDWIEEYPEKHTFDAPVWAGMWRFYAYFAKNVLAWLEGQRFLSNGVFALPGDQFCILPSSRKKTLRFYLYSLPLEGKEYRYWILDRESLRSDFMKRQELIRIARGVHAALQEIEGSRRRHAEACGDGGKDGSIGFVLHPNRGNP